MIFFSRLTDNFVTCANNFKTIPLPKAVSEKDRNNMLKGLKKTSPPFENIPLDLITSIQGASVSLSQNNNRIERLEYNFKLYGSIAVAIIIALIGIILGR